MRLSLAGGISSSVEEGAEEPTVTSGADVSTIEDPTEIAFGDSESSTISMGDAESIGCFSSPAVVSGAGASSGLGTTDSAVIAMGCVSAAEGDGSPAGWELLEDVLVINESNRVFCFMAGFDCRICYVRTLVSERHLHAPMWLVVDLSSQPHPSPCLSLSPPT